MALSGGFGRGRRLSGAAEGLGTSVVVLALVAAIVFAASRPALRVRYDLTQGETYTLTDQTRQVLAGLEEPVEVVTVMRPEPQAVPNGLAEEQRQGIDYVRNLVEEYVVASGGRLTARHIDPFVDRAEVDVLRQRDHLTRSNVVVLRCGDRTEQVFLEELVTIDPGSTNPNALELAELVAYHGEGPLTSALLNVLDEERPRVVFVGGHGEPRVDDLQQEGLGLLAESLRGQGFEVLAADLVGGAPLPDDADVVAVVHPIHSLGTAAVSSLRAHHEDGGALFLALPPWAGDRPLDDLVGDLGAIRERAILVDDQVPYEGAARSVLAVRRWDAEHVITRPMHDQGVVALFPGVAGLNRAPDAKARIRTAFLARTEDHVFGDLFAPGEVAGDFERSGPEELRNSRFVAMAIQGGPGRVVLTNSGAWLFNSSLSDGGRGNMDLALNSFNWLVEREDAVAVRPREVYESRVELYGDETSDVFLYVVVLMPLGGALLGLLGWFVRRR